VSGSTATTSTVTAYGRPTASDAKHPQFSGQESGFAPGKINATGRHARRWSALGTISATPVEDDTIQGGMDEHGMVPEIVVDLEQEVEDINTDLLTTD